MLSRATYVYTFKRLAVYHTYIRLLQMLLQESNVLTNRFGMDGGLGTPKYFALTQPRQGLWLSRSNVFLRDEAPPFPIRDDDYSMDGMTPRISVALVGWKRHVAPALSYLRFLVFIP